MEIRKPIVKNLNSMTKRIVLSVHYEDFIGAYLGSYESSLSDKELILEIIGNMKTEAREHMVSTITIDGHISFFVMDDDGSNYIPFSPLHGDRSDARLVNIEMLIKDKRRL